MKNKFRLYVLSLMLLISPITLFAFAKEINNKIVSDALESRIIQLERIFNAHSELLTQMQQQLSDNQNDIDLLRGQIQKTQYQLSQLIEYQKKSFQDKENKPDNQLPTSFQDIQHQIYLSMEQSNQKNVKNTNSDKKTNKNEEIINLNEDVIDYNKAIVLLLKRKNYEQAISALLNFIRLHPNSTYQPNANYWLGQVNFSHGKKNDALYYFALVAKTYPKSSKAPDALLKVGMLLQEKGQNDKARAIYHQVKKLYPSTEAAKKAQQKLVKV